MGQTTPSRFKDGGMIDADETTENDERCACCRTHLRANRFVRIAGSDLAAFCSSDCLRAAADLESRARSAARRRRAKWIVVAGSLVGAVVTPHQMPLAPRASAPARAPGLKATDATPLPGAFGPPWPPTESSLLDELGRDAWIHPLAGPVRRMPQSDGRVFGAERPGERPAECRNGHCGVDLGGEIWGEHVHAAHDGVVDRVQRGPNDEHGGLYVRVTHREGTVFSQYFHLAAIPRRIVPGVRVKAGDVIGLLGDSGVKESTPHLHFTVSVQPARELPEQYIDPEPLIALWPLRIPIENGAAGVVTTVGKPGVPLGVVTSKRKRRPKKPAPAPAAVGPATEADETPSTDGVE